VQHGGPFKGNITSPRVWCTVNGRCRCTDCSTAHDFSCAVPQPCHVPLHPQSWFTAPLHPQSWFIVCCAAVLIAAHFLDQVKKCKACSTWPEAKDLLKTWDVEAMCHVQHST